MRELNQMEFGFVSGGVWCDYRGEQCSNCAVLIEVEGNDCSVIKNFVNLTPRGPDAGMIIMGIIGTTTGAVATHAAVNIMGMGLVASSGVGLAIGLGIAMGYAYSTRG